MPLGRTNLPRRFKQDDLCRAKLLDNFLDNSLLKLRSLDMAQRRLEVDMKVTQHLSCHLVPSLLPSLKCDTSENFNAALTGGIFLYSAQYIACIPPFMLVPLKNSGRNMIQYIVSRIRYQYSENLVADEKVYVNLIPFIVMYTFLIHSRYSLYKTKKDTVNAILFILQLIHSSFNNDTVYTN